MSLKGCSVVAKLVEKDTECPDVRLLVDGASEVHIDHLWSTVLECGGTVEVSFEEFDFFHLHDKISIESIKRYVAYCGWRFWTGGRGGAKVTQLEERVARL